jgi:hypothetical protein
MRGRKPSIGEMTGIIAAHPRLVKATRIQSTNDRITHEKFGAQYWAMSADATMARSALPSNQIRRHALHRSHVIMKNGLLAAIVPFDGYASPIRFRHGATVGLIVSPANSVADFECSRLVAGHLSSRKRPSPSLIPN